MHSYHTSDSASVVGALDGASVSGTGGGVTGTGRGCGGPYFGRQEPLPFGAFGLTPPHSHLHILLMCLDLVHFHLLNCQQNGVVGLEGALVGDADGKSVGEVGASVG